MKLLFQLGPNGLILSHVECDSTDEADNFQTWYAAKMAAAPVIDLSQAAPADAAPITNDVIEAPNESVQEAVNETNTVKVARSDVSQAAIGLVQTKGRNALNPILAKYSAKRISEISDENLAGAYVDIQEAAK